MDVARQNAGGIVALGLLGIAWVLTLAGIYTVEGYAVLAAGQFASGVLAAGTFSLGVLSAGIFSAGPCRRAFFLLGFFDRKLRCWPLRIRDPRRRILQIGKASASGLDPEAVHILHAASDTG